MLFELATEINRTGSPELVRQLLGLGRILNILGMDPEIFLQGGAEASDDASRIEGLIEERALAKKAKNFARADEIRKSLPRRGNRAPRTGQQERPGAAFEACAAEIQTQQR